MTPDDATAEPVGAEATSWRELAVTRSLDPARVRAEKRVQRFLDAALELMSTSDNKDFTVQQVVLSFQSFLVASLPLLACQ